MNTKKMELILYEFKENIDSQKINNKFLKIYEHVCDDLKIIFAYYHERINFLFSQMNGRAKSNKYFLADDSRELLKIIEILKDYQKLLKNSQYDFYLCESYQKHLDYTLLFLKEYRGSQIPDDYQDIELIKYEPVFFQVDSLTTNNLSNDCTKIELKLIGEGAYAKVFSFKEPLTKNTYAMKRLKNDVIGKELDRFKLEFEKMNSINNPYILKAYSYNENDNSYITEYCDLTLNKYITKNNTKEFMNFKHRKNIAFQFLKGLSYLHSKGLLHRDISFNNILLKTYDDNVITVKLSDFGLMKDINLELTRTDSEIRGTIIDDTLTSFKDYNIKNEIYSVGVVIWFIFTGKTNLKIDDSNIGKIVNKCINRNLSTRYDNIMEIMKDLNSIIEYKNEDTIYLKKDSISISKIKKNIDLNIDDKAFTILKAMVEDKKNNQIYYTKTLDGEKLQTSDGSFILKLSDYTPREQAFWKDSFESLIKNSYIKSIGNQNEIFEVTSSGYKLYDLQK